MIMWPGGQGFGSSSEVEVRIPNKSQYFPSKWGGTPLWFIRVFALFNEISIFAELSVLHKFWSCEVVNLGGAPQWPYCIYKGVGGVRILGKKLDNFFIEDHFRIEPVEDRRLKTLCT